MNMQTLTSFFMWCTVINSSLLLVWALVVLLAPGLLYSLQKRWCPVSRETYDAIMYCLLGAFKIIVLVFNLVPYIALVLAG